MNQLNEKLSNEFWARAFTFAIRMAAASLTVVSLMFVVTYQFKDVNQLTESFKWMRFSHDGIVAVIFFSLSSIMGLIQKAPFLNEKCRKLAGYAMLLTLSIGLGIILFLFTIIFINTA